MRLMLTSFGIEQSISSEAADGDSMFHRMPPVSFRQISEAFMPDYELLLLSDAILMDGASYGQLVESPLGAYARVADTLRALRADGRIELVDFVSILRSNASLLERMIEHDMRILDQWVVPLRESLSIWRTFVQNSGEIMHHREYEEDARGHMTHLDMRHLNTVFMHNIRNHVHIAVHEAAKISYLVDDALHSSEKRKRKEYRSALREVLRSYLEYINANLVISNELNVAFHDWLDFTPFYSAKFMSVGKAKNGTEEARKELKKLFTIAFPDLAIHDTRALLRALSDKRIEDLRKLVDDAVLGKVEFDEKFAREVLANVLQCERRSGKARSIVGYLTMPVGFIPWIGTPAQKLLEESIGTPIERKIKSENKWFYMLSEIADSAPRGSGKLSPGREQ